MICKAYNLQAILRLGQYVKVTSIVMQENCTIHNFNTIGKCYMQMIIVVEWISCICITLKQAWYA